ncbi:methionyl-tRNA synthetase, mitochondrial [Arctopsyche grandis]|uniref:methionyl-tRNA synthetase, mitochondrial n=1 Tax=Arctopsyche grandis TaxID=121162 RepID=UPI00406D6517
MLSRLSAAARPLYVTTPIFYVNAPPHIGHLYSAVIADSVQRFRKLLDPATPIIFSTGTDEHGTKVQQAALKKKVSLDKYCTSVSDEYKKLFEDCGVEFTDFVRTTEDRHKTAVQHFWSELKNRDFIYSSKYSGWYCINDETFLTESHLRKDTRDGKEVLVSIDSGHSVEWTEEQNYMFRLSSFKSDLENWFKKDVITPRKYQDIIMHSMIDSSFSDISVSRPSDRVHWAIKVPDDPSQSVYVWLDALINYLTVVGYPNEIDMTINSSWPVDLHVIGKDILKFHAIYWPAFLMAVGLEPPRKILCHGHWTVNGKKMSKSLNNIVNPYETVTKLEALRYFLLREGTMHSDANYSELKMSQILNSELADTLGNLLNRCTSTLLNPRQEFPQLHYDEFRKMKENEATHKLISLVENLSETCFRHYDNYDFYKVVDCVIAALHSANLFFSEYKPWELRKSLETQKDLDVVLHLTLETIRICSIILLPIIPNMSTKLLDKLLIPEEYRTWYFTEYISWQNDMILETRNISSKKLLLFQKIALDIQKEVTVS